MNAIQIGVFVALASVWAWVLGRPVLQNLFNGARRDPVGHFNRQLTVLGRAPERSLAHETRGMSGQAWGRQPARKRRLQLMMALVVSVVVSGVLAIVFGGIFVWQVTLLAMLLAGYFVLAARAGAYEAERGAKVAYLHAAPATRPVQIHAVGER